MVGSIPARCSMEVPNPQTGRFRVMTISGPKASFRLADSKDSPSPLASHLLLGPRGMISDPILSLLCAAEFSPGDVAHLVVWDNGQVGIVRNGEQVGQERWQRGELSECAKAFLNYVRLIRRRVTMIGNASELPAA